MASKEIAGQVTVCSQGEVLMKIYADCNGENAAAVAEVIRDMQRVPAMQEAYTLAMVAGLGCEECRIVLAKSFEADSAESAPATNFSDVMSCPYQGRGTAEHLEVVDLYESMTHTMEERP